MTRQEILTKAIEKATDNGWKEPDGNKLEVDEGGNIFCFVGTVKAYGYQFNRERLIYNHDFAKALWPSGLCECGQQADDFHTAARPGRVIIHARKNDWKHHLQQMVIAPDPIKYLGEHL